MNINEKIETRYSKIRKNNMAIQKAHLLELRTKIDGYEEIEKKKKKKKKD